MVREFIKHVLSFLAVLVMWFLFSGSFNLIVPRLFSDACPELLSPCEPGEHRVLVAGDSHVMRAIDPDLWPHSASIAQEAEPYALTYWKLRRTLPIVQPDTVIIGFAPHNLSSFNDHKFSAENWSEEMIRRSFPIATTDIPLPEVDLAILTEVVFFDTMLYPTTPSDDWIGGFSDSFGTDFSITPFVVERHYTWDGKLSETSEYSVSLLDSLVHLVEEFEATLVLLNTPVHESYSIQIPEIFSQVHDSLMSAWQQEGVIVVDASEMEVPDSLFLNADHLNSLGAEWFTQYLRRGL